MLKSVSNRTMLPINAAEHFVRGERQNQLSQDTSPRLSRPTRNREEEPVIRRVEMTEIEKNEFQPEYLRCQHGTGGREIDLHKVHQNCRFRKTSQPKEQTQSFLGKMPVLLTALMR